MKSMKKRNNDITPMLHTVRDKRTGELVQVDSITYLCITDKSDLEYID